MLDAIERSQAALTSSLTAQSQLVADASHELRTPIASLRTDVESLIAHPELDAAARERRLVEVEARVEELTALVNDVIELARGDAPAAEHEDVRLDELAAESIEWLHRHAPERRVEAKLQTSVVEGRPDRIARAINNLLDNANKYSPSTEPIEVSVADHTIVVRDHGPASRPSAPRRSSPAFTGATTRAPFPARASALRSSVRSPSRTAARSRSRPRTAAARRSGCDSAEPSAGGPAAVGLRPLDLGQARRAHPAGRGQPLGAVAIDLRPVAPRPARGVALEEVGLVEPLRAGCRSSRSTGRSRAPRAH